MKVVHIGKVKYRCSKFRKTKLSSKSVEVLGIDTEAFTTGRCFMIATSLGDVFNPVDFPQCMFNRKYRGKTYVAYNLKYDEGAFLQNVPYKNLQELRETNSTKHDGFKYRIIPRKMLSISRSSNAITFYDLAGFFKTSLDKASKELLKEGKLELETKEFSFEYVCKNYERIAEYCIKDALLCKRLADILISRFEGFGIYPKKLYSTAYISYQYFNATCDYPVVKRYWNYYRSVLDYAMQSYNGGKFEVTTKGTGYFYEYDVNSQYPNQIANLLDITNANVIYDTKYLKKPQYGFIKCTVEIPIEINSPVAIKNKYVNTFPCGIITKVITKQEYDYLLEQGCTIQIHDAWYLYMPKEVYPFRDEIIKLSKMKDKLKGTENKIDYYIIKLLLNSLYGKFVQLIEKSDHFAASTCWNPIYGAIITANGRIQVTRMQQKYDTVVAVHTDSIITSTKLPLLESGKMGEFSFEEEGEGVILGSGIYQIGEKSRFRGFSTKTSIMDLVKNPKSRGKIKVKRPLTWREVIFHGWPSEDINLFKDMTKELRVDFDQKRFWLDDWESFDDVLKFNVPSIPFYCDSLLSS